MFGSQGGRDHDREALLQQRRRAQRQAQHEEYDDDEQPHRSSGGFIKRDLQMGLALLVAVGLMIGPRFLPTLEPRNAGDETVVQRAEPDAIALPKSTSEPAFLPPKPAGQSPLTDIVPKGYAAEKEKPARSDDKLVAPILPPNKAIAENSKSTGPKLDPMRTAAQKSDVVTEFVPFEESTKSKPKERKEPPRLDSDAAGPQSLKPHVDPNKDGSSFERTKLIGLPKPAQDNGVKVESSERAASAGKSAAKAGPIHPFFQRYLDDKEYPVRYGDTFEVIAYRLYGDEAKAGQIRAANPGIDKPRSGARLRLP